MGGGREMTRSDPNRSTERMKLILQGFKSTKGRPAFWQDTPPYVMAEDEGLEPPSP